MKTASLLTTFLAALFLLCTQAALGQGVAINAANAAPNPNAALDVTAANKGVLIPRIDYNNRPVNSVPSGMLIYVTANGPQGNKAFYYYDGVAWQKVRNYNEQQTLALSHDTLFLSQSNYVPLGSVFTSQGYIKCGTQYVNPSNDPGNCGTCGFACPAGKVCVGGSCVLTCAAGQTNCNGTCRDLQTSNQNCGSCGFACAAGQVCSNGSCVVSCGPGLTNCAGNCRNLQSENQNCGSCGLTCPSGQVCANGVCSVSCAPGHTICSGVCRDLQTNNQNCGVCGFACAAGQICANGACVVTCQAGLTNCGGTCRSLQSDNLNCGACGNVCTGSLKCVNSVCQ